MVVLPAVSVPALAAFSEAFGYWEDRTRFVMNGNLTTAVATQQALSDPNREDSYIGLLSGDYVMVAKKDTEALAKELPNLDLEQGYLVRKDADKSQPLETRAEAAVPGMTYTTMRLAVKPIDPNCNGKTAASDSAGSSSDKSSGKKPGEKPPQENPPEKKKPS
jgi:hypothetical protein